MGVAWTLNVSTTDHDSVRFVKTCFVTRKKFERRKTRECAVCIIVY